MKSASAAVEQEQIVPAWLRSNFLHRREFEHDIFEQPTEEPIKSAAVEEEYRDYDINAPSWLNVHDANPMTKTMSEHRYDEPKKDERIEAAKEQHELK
ncbi:MAG: hypothetical protein WCF23_06380 [Candidatus Nitrosopolaris sp.]